MTSRPALRLALLVGGAVLVLVAAAAVTWFVVRPGGGDLVRAARLAPADAQRLSWVDWAGVRTLAAEDGSPGLPDGGAPAPDASGAEVELLIDVAYDRDLSAPSSLGQSAVPMQERLGFSPATVAWESFTQSERGAVTLLGTDGDDAFFERVPDALEDTGFDSPEADERLDGGLWELDLGTAAQLGLSPQLTFLALLEDDGLVLASDDPAYLADAVEAARGDGAGMADGAEAVRAVAATVTDGGDDPLAAVVLDAALVCSSLAMSEADPAAQDEGRALVEAVGGVAPLAAYAIAIGPEDGTGTVALGFENGDQASDDAEARAALASGPAPGQGGTFAERFEVEEAVVDGAVVRLDVTVAEDAFVLSDLGSGPVLFATC